MASGPTQNYDDAALDSWRPHPVLAATLRATLYLLPTAIAVSFGLSAAHWFPASRLGISPWLWLAAEVGISAGLLLATHKAVARLVPLTGLLKLALVFPDHAPSRLTVAMRSHSPSALGRALRGRPHTDDPAGRLLLDLVAALYAHDPLTRAHSERVQGYAVMIGQQLGLSAEDAAKLSWAALLHDIGKLRVPTRILAKRGRPTDAEWSVLAGHPSAGAEIARPLADWLGPWLDAVGQHHERWDGEGYPAGLRGEQISLAARVVAVADAYDVITSARSYKDAMPASRARAELARCAGSQFDPRVVRAFLAVGLGRLRATAGPLSLLSGLPGIRGVPLDLSGVAPAVGQALSGVAATVGAAVIGATIGLVPAAAEGATTADSPAAADHVTVDGDGGTDELPPRRDGTGAPATDPTSTASATSDPGAETTTPGDEPSATSAPSTEPGTAPTHSPTGAAPSSSPTPSKPPVQASACDRALSGDTDLAGVTLHSCNLTGADLAGADFTGADLDGVNFTDAQLTGARFDDAMIANSRFTNARLTGAKFTGATIIGTTFVGAKTNGDTLSGASLLDCTF